jgi:hypothetical protein
MKKLIFAATAMSLAGIAIAQEVPPAAPTQGIPPTTTTPAPATPDATTPTPPMTDTAPTSGDTTAPVPAASADTNTSQDVPADGTHAKHKKKPR